MYPYERSLVKKYSDKPFALVGVNSDGKEELEGIIADRTIKWPCFWDGGDAGGPIARQWHVMGWPTIYILDENGVIRYKVHGNDQEIDDDIYKLLTKLKEKSAGAKSN
jgi:peroxiredoxin